jgi:three-Cys-motif partner protein
MVLPHYEDREQTAVKHEILARYLSAFVPIVGDWAADIAYIDCLAGPWKSVGPNFEDTSFARAIGVLRDTRRVLGTRGKSPSMRCLFIEKGPEAFSKLKAYCDGINDIEVIPKEWDLAEHIPDVVRFARERNKSFPFVFIDPNGWETLEIELIRPILSLVPGEVLINFMTSWITRFLSDESKGFRRLFSDDWERLVQLKGEEQEEEIVSSYARLVRLAGKFDYVCTLPVMKPSQDAFHYYMIYGTRHIKGVEVFKKTEEHVIPFMHETRAQAQQRRRFEQSGQHPLFGPQASYRETKFTRFLQRSLERAKSELRRDLESSRNIRFDDAWANVMQHSGVTEGDLRDWLTEWKNQGLLEITNQKPKQIFPRRGQQQSLMWIGS